ncbi:STAS domain-containing protein [Methylophaga pinxianii]|uniref:STAS domain-containing protein n=1 Tax=Methylophaga pinxianii TaxID=2881052 RepID=UPI001CF25E31|nr:STAS domain-containing protein [Methylophaga pinxianii]MCB2427807.1 STAS domain-containing protein [Methylophaga pinxianii]UPH45589.1 STAS domain-containing protein [Methylophaga pinxianii]
MKTKTVTLDCGQHLGIAQLEMWYVQCLKILLTGDRVLIDVSRIQKIDMAALQLLYQFHIEAQQYGVELIWSVMSERFQDSINLSGLSFTINEQQTSSGLTAMENN